MILFNTRSTDRLAQQLDLPRGACTIKNFSDGEIYVKINEDVAGKDVCILAATPAPADNYFEMFLLLNALQRAQARISLLFTYFGYARQDKAQPGEALGSEVISTFLKTFTIKKISIIHAHSTRFHELLDFEDITPYEPFCAVARTHHLSVIVAPDRGATSRVEQVAERCGTQAAFVSKTRSVTEQVDVIALNGDVEGKNVLIVDDMITTGSTILHVAAFLKEHGARDIYVCAAHGVFAPGTREKLQNAETIKKIYVTDTLPQQPPTDKIDIIPIASFLKETLEKIVV